MIMHVTMMLYSLLNISLVSDNHHFMVYWVTELIEVVVTWSRKSAIFIIVADLEVCHEHLPKKTKVLSYNLSFHSKAFYHLYIANKMECFSYYIKVACLPCR